MLSRIIVHIMCCVILGTSGPEQLLWSYL